MSAQRIAPSRADHVGSLLHELKNARALRDRDRITAVESRAIEDRLISDAVKHQQRVGLKSVTDGEFRRRSLNFHFLSLIEGIEVVVDEHSVRFEG